MMRAALLCIVVLLASCSSGPPNPPDPPQLYMVMTSWDPVTTLTTGEPVADITGYQVRYGRAGQEKLQAQFTTANAAEIIVTAGTWVFDVMAISGQYGPSDPATEVVKTVP